MGLPIPDDMDGVVLAEAFERKHMDASPPTYSRGAGRLTDRSFSFNPDDDAKLKEKLKNLGYL